MAQKTDEILASLLETLGPPKACVRFIEVPAEYKERYHGAELACEHVTDDQRADIANEVREIRSEIAEKEKMAKARETKANPSIRANSAHIDTPKPIPTRKAVNY
jgi:hypothetical protein